MKYLLIISLLFCSLFGSENLRKMEMEMVFKENITNMLDNYKKVEKAETVIFNNNIMNIGAFGITESYDLNNIDSIEFVNDNKNRLLFIITSDNKFFYFTSMIVYEKIMFQKFKLLLIKKYNNLWN